MLGKLPTASEYLEVVTKKIDPFAASLYRYLNFDQIAGFENEGRIISTATVAELSL